MAKAQYVQKGWGQVEPNRLLGIAIGDMESQAPVCNAATFTPDVEEVENGRVFVLGSKAPTGVAGFPAGITRTLRAPSSTDAHEKAAPYLMFSEKKIYDERDGYSSFVMKKKDSVDGYIFPRAIKLHEGDVFTTNTIDAAPSSVALNAKLYVQDNGYIGPTEGENKVLQFKVIKLTTMPDGQPGVKLLVEKHQG